MRDTFCPRIHGCNWCFCCGHDGDENDEHAEVIVHMNDPHANAPFDYPDNFIKTSDYTIVTFLPLALLMQFRKVSNFYFLVCMVLSLIPGVSPISPATAIAPLVFVVAVALVKEGAEEYKRHRADNRANSIEVEAFVNGEMVRIASRHLRAGDVVRVHNGEEVRADIFLLSSSTEEGQVFIDTCNLDGEASLKSRKAMEMTWPLCSTEAVQTARLTMHTTPPDPGLLSWNGRIDFNGEEYAVDLNQFLYRGCVVRKTDWLWGFVIYAGRDTKMFRNLKKRPPKSSDLDHKLNTLIIVVFLMQNAFLIVLCSLAVWWSNHHKDHWYMRWFLEQNSETVLWFRRYVTYFILLSYFIPISLFVTIEVCKVIQVHWMRRDTKMMELVNGRWRRCVPNTSNLNEQLAMVRFIFTDKTGTLTENVMKFKTGDIKGHTICCDSWAASLELLDHKSPTRAAAEEYFLALSICHTVQPFNDDSNPLGIVYEGSSPDEVALVTTAAEHGFRLVERTSRSMTVEVEEQNRVFDILATLEFTPDRKMMSIIVQERNTPRIILFTKGADSSLRQQLSNDSEVQEYMIGLDSTLTEMGESGLRTLLVGARDLTQEEFKVWHARFIAAGKTLVRRSEVVDKVCIEIERELRLVGATAIEDKLQDDVPETVSFFLNAGVVIWMLTGDKRETALTIAATTMLCDPRRDFVLHIDIGSLDPKDEAAVQKVGADLRQVELHVERGREEGVRCTIVIDGLALGVAMTHHFKQFLRLSQEVNSAVCCRLTPLQKANIVRMFQKSTGLTAIAIGDGANDVSMIQEGRVGIGIVGLEGTQAVLAADYAIPRFKNLRYLCAVHGRYSLVRNASCIVVSFYKNITLSFIQVVFAFYCGFSGLTLFDGWLLTFYNTVLTSIPPFFMGIFDKDLCAEVLVSRPDLFVPLSRGLYFDHVVLLQWLAESIFHALVIFYVMYPTAVKLDYDGTRNIGGDMVGTMMLFSLVCVVLSRFGLQVRYWRWMQYVGIGLSALFLVCLLLTYSAIQHVGNATLYWHIYVLMTGAKFWLYVLLLLGGLILVVDLPVLHFQKRLKPTPRDIAEQEHERALKESGMRKEPVENSRQEELV
ncbi:phospholipid-transporting ATPase 1-like protein [Trypanosoma grayi]|uniref:phospholipid-transporting ATPase 1-like protein n=1 Tax=Trypanosoma grayi TaxID=71804 RepID=UPI0004F4B01C|nr:phospholipid-transporting ATPase 1-like protein [Trypanosoma grayi]KEG15008.1 phospholipid-transporting ATPase 1-like protein [Trypanosoma grayi]